MQKDFTALKMFEGQTCGLVDLYTVVYWNMINLVTDYYMPQETDIFHAQSFSSLVQVQRPAP